MDSGSGIELDPSQGAWAVSHARTVVEQMVETGRRPDRPADVDDAFEIDRGAFVTLKKQGELRGCIGRPMPEQPAIDAIRGAAIDAATDDPRFPPIAPRELPFLITEVSVLTPPEPIDSPDPTAITVGRDGLIVSGSGRSGLLLPQVSVDQGWDAETFLEQTCRKAGLPGDSWRHPDVSVVRFRAQVFEESEPKGPVVNRTVGEKSPESGGKPI